MALSTGEVMDLMRSVAADVITPRFRSLSDAQIDEKRPGDLVTIADKEAEALLTGALVEAYPDAVVLGEETYADSDLLERFRAAGHGFTVDPVDGTKNFVNGSRDHAVMIAEVVDGVTVRGWIWQPEHENAWVAELGEGVRRNGDRVRRTPAGERPQGATSIWSRRGRQPEGLPPLLGSWVCCGIDYPKLIEGAAPARWPARPRRSRTCATAPRGLNSRSPGSGDDLVPVEHGADRPRQHVGELVLAVVAVHRCGQCARARRGARTSANRSPVSAPSTRNRSVTSPGPGSRRPSPGRPVVAVLSSWHATLGPAGGSRNARIWGSGGGRDLPAARGTRPRTGRPPGAEVARRQLDLAQLWREVAEAADRGRPPLLDPVLVHRRPRLVARHQPLPRRHGGVPAGVARGRVRATTTCTRSSTCCARRPGSSTLHEATGGDPSHTARWQANMTLGGDQELILRLRTGRARPGARSGCTASPTVRSSTRTRSASSWPWHPRWPEGARRALLVGEALHPDWPDGPGSGRHRSRRARPSRPPQTAAQWLAPTCPTNDRRWAGCRPRCAAPWPAQTTPARPAQGPGARRRGDGLLTHDLDPHDRAPQDACGVFGVWAPGEDVAKLTYYGLYALQHRGQESAGIAVSNSRQILVYKDMGLVSQVFDESTLAALKGHLAIGHSRYSTTGASTWNNAQPTFRPTADGSIALCHNGNLTNTRDLQQLIAEMSVERKRADIHARKLETSTNDTSLVTALLANHPRQLPRGACRRDPAQAERRLLVRLDGRDDPVRRPRPPGHPAARAGPARARLGRGQ